MNEKKHPAFEDSSIKEYVQKWGGSTSHALLDPACSIFKPKEIDGIIGYRFESNCAIVFGDPVCDPNDCAQLAQSFHHYCQNNGKNIIYTGVSEHFANLAVENNYGALIKFGNEIVIDPCIDVKLGKGKHASLLRNKYNQSIRDGIQVKEYIGFDSDIEEKINAVTEAWLKNRKGPQVYLLQVNIFSDRSAKRWFYAEYNNEIIGAVMLNRLDAHEGWVLNLLTRLPESPNSTSEFLILEVLKKLQEEQCTFFSIGAIPAPQLEAMIGFSFISMLLAKIIYRTAKRIFQLSDRERFWKKFQPKKKPSYLVFSNSRLRLRDVLALMRALNMGF